MVAPDPAAASGTSACPTHEEVAEVVGIMINFVLLMQQLTDWAEHGNLYEASPMQLFTPQLNTLCTFRAVRMKHLPVI